MVINKAGTAYGVLASEFSVVVAALDVSEKLNVRRTVKTPIVNIANPKLLERYSSITVDQKLLVLGPVS